MEIQVTLHGIMRDYLPREAKGKTTLELPPGATIEAVLAALKIERTINGAVNGEQVEVTHVLQEGDEVQIFRPIGGG
jgi:sulfur carrier protein ThiS